MYDNVVTSVRTSDRDTNDFPINMGLHQGSALNPYLFALVMDGITRDIYKVVSLGVCYLQMMWFWWMRVGQGLTIGWSCGDEL
jgi:hypothetical protein